MDSSAIRREVIRLSPWYYLFDLRGVRTDLRPSFDQHGHRSPNLPAFVAQYLAGKTVLDVGCNEGWFSFGALDHGATRVVGFDVREVNIEKARLVKEVTGRQEATFSVSSCDRWIAESDGDSFDVVFLLGLLYHLPEPWKTIEQYSALANHGMLVSSVLAGGDEDGYTPLIESETIGASEEPDVASMMPNTSNTLIQEFSKHGFRPTFVQEIQWGTLQGCTLLFVNCKGAKDVRRAEDDGMAPEVDLYVTPGISDEDVISEGHLKLTVTAYNQSSRPREIEQLIFSLDQHGNRLEVLSRVEFSLVKKALRPRKGRYRTRSQRFAEQSLHHWRKWVHRCSHVPVIGSRLRSTLEKLAMPESLIQESSESVTNTVQLETLGASEFPRIDIVLRDRQTGVELNSIGSYDPMPAAH